MDILEDIEKWIEGNGEMEKIISSLPTDSVLEKKSRVYGALSDPTRLKILHILSITPLCVCLIKRAVEMSDSKLSYHLSVLKKSGLTTGKRKKNWIVYSITDEGKEYIKA